MQPLSELTRETGQPVKKAPLWNGATHRRQASFPTGEIGFVGGLMSFKNPKWTSATLSGRHCRKGAL